jgi:hypothetical protein
VLVYDTCLHDDMIVLAAIVDARKIDYELRVLAAAASDPRGTNNEGNERGKD